MNFIMHDYSFWMEAGIAMNTNKENWKDAICTPNGRYTCSLHRIKDLFLDRNVIASYIEARANAYYFEAFVRAFYVLNVGDQL